MRMKSLGLLVALIALGAGCAAATTEEPGATETPSAAGAGVVASKKACDLIDPTEASAAMGVTLGAGASETTGYDAVPGAETSYCGFTNGEPTPDTLRVMTVTLYRFTSASLAAETLKASQELFEDAESISWLGDGAYWSPTTAQLYVVKGDYQLVITIIEPGKGQGRDKAKAAAAIVLPRL